MQRWTKEVRALRTAPLVIATVVSVACGAAKADGTPSKTAAGAAAAPAVEKPSASELTAPTLTRAVAAKLISASDAWVEFGAWRYVTPVGKNLFPTDATCAQDKSASPNSIEMHLVDLGLWTLVDTITYSGDHSRSFKECYVRLTDKAKLLPTTRRAAAKANVDLYVESEPNQQRREESIAVRAARVGPLTVTGIVQEAGGTIANVEFSYVWMASQYTAKLGLDPAKFQSGNGVAKLRRYDDGWRVMTIQP